MIELNSLEYGGTPSKFFSTPKLLIFYLLELHVFWSGERKLGGYRFTSLVWMCVCVQAILFLRHLENELICLFWATYRECNYSSSFAEQFWSWKNFIFFLKISKPINIFSVDSKCESDPVGFWLIKCLVPKIDFVCATRYKRMLYFHKKVGDFPFPYCLLGLFFFSLFGQFFIFWTNL